MRSRPRFPTAAFNRFPTAQVWGAERPAPPSKPMRVHAAEWAGETVSAKLEKVRAEMAKVGAQALVVAMLDEVCWLLNVRGGDVDFNPVTVAYALVHSDSASLYLDAAKVPSEVAEHLAAAGVTVKAPTAVWADIAAAAKAGKAVWADPAKARLRRTRKRACAERTHSQSATRSCVSSQRGFSAPHSHISLCV